MFGKTFIANLSLRFYDLITHVAMNLISIDCKGFSYN